METIKNVSGMLCLAGCILFGANCADVDTDNEADTDEVIDAEEWIAQEEEAYVSGPLTAADKSFLNELDAYFAKHKDGLDYPMCVYPEEGGAAITNPDGVAAHMGIDVSTWLSYLYGRWGWKVQQVTFSLKATTEAGCAATYDGTRPFSVTSYTGKGAGGWASKLLMRWPAGTINDYGRGKQPRVVLHEIGHLFGLGHANGEAAPSVMDYADFNHMSGLGGDDIVGVTRQWKVLSGQVAPTECEFGYAGPPCKASGGSLLGREIKNHATNECIETPSTADGVTLVKAPCNKTPNQRFSMKRNANGTWQMFSVYTKKCASITDAADGQTLTQVPCDPLSLNQNFGITKNETGTYKIMSEYSHKVLQVNGAALNQWKPLGKNKQSWYLNWQ